MKQIFSILIFLMLFAISSCGNNDPNNETNARVMVWHFVENNLKDPSSAKFGTCKMEQNYLGNWETDCYVDAKNSFGGTQRINFTCEVKHVKGDKWELVKLNIK